MSLAGNNWSHVGLDETHEMTVNKDVKQLMKTDNMSKITGCVKYLPFRAHMHRNLLLQLQPNTVQAVQQEDSAAYFKDTEANIKALFRRISNTEYSPFSGSKDPSVLTHIFSGLEAAPLEENDLMNLRENGNSALENYIECYLTGEIVCHSGQKGGIINSTLLAQHVIPKRKRKEVL